MEKFTYLDYLKYARQTKLKSIFVLREDSAKYELEKIHQPQDKGYKVVFDNKQEAVKFINKVLKLKNTQNELKPKEIEICNTSFITTDFKKKRADIIYKKKNQNVFFLDRAPIKSRLFNGIQNI